VAKRWTTKWPYIANALFGIVKHCGLVFQVLGGRLPTPGFLAASDAFWEFSYNQHLSFLVYSPMFKSAPPACEQVFLNERRGD